jgi:23S rRNA (pseudouridine1915-N3)-methyltransferase
MAFIWNSKIYLNFVTMKIILLLTGKSEPSWIRSSMELYEERISHYTGYARVEIPELKFTGSLSEKQIKEKEGDLIIKNVKQSDFLVLLDERGEELTSVMFARYIEKKAVSGTRSLVFCIGGPYGFSEQVYKRADASISLSKMTFPHQLVRLVFLEQLYRAFTINSGEPYHHI